MTLLTSQVNVQFTIYCSVKQLYSALFYQLAVRLCMSSLINEHTVPLQDLGL